MDGDDNVASLPSVVKGGYDPAVLDNHGMAQGAVLPRTAWSLSSELARISQSSTRSRDGAPAAAGVCAHLSGDHSLSAPAEEILAAAGCSTGADTNPGSAFNSACRSDGVPGPGSDRRGKQAGRVGSGDRRRK